MIRAFKRNRGIRIAANNIAPYYPLLAQRGQLATAVVITNRTSATLYVSELDRPDMEYDIAIPPGSAGPLVNPEGIHALYLYASAAGFFDATEVSTDNPDLQFQVWNMQFTATSPLPAGYNVIGRTIMQNAAGDLAPGNPLDTTFAVAGGQVGPTNPMPVKPGNGLVPLPIVAGAAGQQQVKAGAGRVFAVVSTAACTLRNNGVDVWSVPANVPQHFSRPIEFGVNIQVNFTAAGTCYVMYE